MNHEYDERLSKQILDKKASYKVQKSHIGINLSAYS